MVEIQLQHLEAPDTITKGHEFRVRVAVDNMENLAPLSGGNCWVGTTQGELTDVNLKVKDAGGTTIFNESETVCAPYGPERDDKFVEYNITINETGSYVFYLSAQTQRGTKAETYDELDPFRVDVTTVTDVDEPPQDGDNSDPGTGDGDGNNTETKDPLARILTTAVENPTGVLVAGGATVFGLSIARDMVLGED